MTSENPWKQIDTLKARWDREIERVRRTVEANRVGRFTCTFEGTTSDGVITRWSARVPGPITRLEYRTSEDLIAAVRVLVLRRNGITDLGETPQTEGRR